MPKPPPKKERPAPKAEPAPAKSTKVAPVKAAPEKPAKAPAATSAAAKPVRKATVAFPKKNQPPTAAAFAARLPLALGRRVDMVRTFLQRQEGVVEELHFYGPAAGWALRYLLDGRPLSSLHLHDDQPVGIVSLDPACIAAVDWTKLSPIAQKARRIAHGSPSLIWLDLPLAGAGATDFRDILRAKIALLGRQSA